MVIFTAEEHLVVQEQIERRAHEIWGLGGYCHGTALNDWVKAECEIVENFILACARSHSVPQSSAAVASSKPGTRFLKRGRTIIQRGPHSASELVTFPQ